MRRSPPGFGSVKLNTVVIRGYNDDEVVDLLEFARARGVEPRFIEYMDVGGATGWSHGPGRLPARDPRDASARRYGPVEPAPARTTGRRPSGSRCRTGPCSASSRRTTAPFCRTCDRGRLTADGTFLLCLYGERRPRSAGAAPRRRVATRRSPAGSPRPGAGAPTAGPRSARRCADRGVLHRIESLRADPRREMHTRGG